MTDKDLLDGLLWAEGLVKKNREYSHVSDYPEHLQPILKAFISVWKLRDVVVPSKKIKGRYDLWTKGLETLYPFIKDGYIKETFEIAYKKYNTLKDRYPVSHPLAIRDLLIDADAELERLIEKYRLEQEKINSRVTMVDEEKSKEVLNNLRDFFRKDE